jgi:GT2 family glycosyltransferase
VLAQTFSDIELIVACEKDDAATVEALATVADPRVRLVVNPIKSGPGIARDLGARAAAGHWVAFLDDDDEWLPAKLERQLAVAKDETIVMTLSNVVTPAGIFVRPARPYAEDEPVDEWLFARRTWFRGGDSMMQTSSLMMPALLFGKLGFGSARHEEWELVIRAVKQHGYRLVTVREPLVTYYTGGMYPWRTSVDWVETMTGLLSPRAVSGFCLNVATQGLAPVERNRAFLTLLRTAFRLGRPEARQLLAFFLIWTIPDSLRDRLRAALGRRPRQHGVTV